MSLNFVYFNSAYVELFFICELIVSKLVWIELNWHKKHNSSFQNDDKNGEIDV